MDIKTFHQSIRSVEFDPESVTYKPPPGLLDAVDRIEKALKSRNVSKADCERIVATMIQAKKLLLEAREDAVRKARLSWDLMGR